MKSYGDHRARVSMNILLVMFSYPILSYGVQSTPVQIFYPGIIVYFNCIVPNPFIEVDGIVRTSERGIDGYIEDLSAMGIEAKGVNNLDSSFIPTVCINGSSANLTQFDTLTITITCQEIQLDLNFQQPPQIIPHFSFTLTYQGRLPAPEYVRMNDNNILVWGRPPCVTNSSSNTYSIEVFHTLELTYIIYITRVSNGATVINITVSTTFYDLSLATMLEPCSEYRIEVFAQNTEIELVGERSLPVLYTHRMQGCSPVTSSSDSEVVDTTIPTPINREDKTEPTNIPTEIVAGAIVGVVVVLLVIIVAIIFIIYWFSKRNRKQNAVKNVPINVEDFIAEDNMYMYAESNSPPTYEQSKQPDCPVAGEEQQINGVYSTVHVQTTQPTHIASVNPSINGNTKGQPQTKKQDNDQQSRKRDLIYTDVAVTETTGWIAPPAADTQTYVTVQTKPHTD